MNIYIYIYIYTGRETGCVLYHPSHPTHPTHPTHPHHQPHSTLTARNGWFPHLGRFVSVCVGSPITHGGGK